MAVFVIGAAFVMPGLATPIAWAQIDNATSAPGAALEREVLSLQQQLAAINAEVRALKQGRRSLSADYRLRQRLADAEALGRKLTDAEALLRAERRARGEVAEPTVMPPSGAAPHAAATDGPAELAAKADILLDQAVKLAAQADRIEQRAERERQRNTLRARARHLEQDPFIGLESSKRNLAFSSRSVPTRTGDEARPESATDGVKAGGASAGAGQESAPPAAPANDDLASGGGSARPGGTGAPTTSVPPPADNSGGAGSVAVGFRALLDAGTLAQIDRLEGSGDPRARAKAMEALVAALRKQASELQARAKALQTQR